MSETIEIILSAEELEGTEATVSQWLINEGDSIKTGTPVVELETDKVSMEICSPDSGVLQKIVIKEGEKAEVNSILGVLTNITTESIQKQVLQAKQNNQGNNSKHLVSPAVRRLLKENNLDIEQISGTGKNGRVNRNDIEAFLATGEKPLERVADTSSDKISEISSRLIPHSTMRKAIAKHMVESLLETSPHVTSVFEMDMSNIIEHRKWHKKEYAEQNVNLTYTAYFLMAMVDAIKQVPECNARFHKEALEIFNTINIGVGTALAEKGLVVPVVHDVQDMSLFDVAKALSKQTFKARNGDLTSADMKNGTITISNHGVSGSLFAAPIIINQPQVAILGIGKLEKRVIVEEINKQDTMQIKSMCYVSLSIDHRALDAHLTNLFLSNFVAKIESWGQ
ncbi:MAG: dihydrolipoamide succinyltransferase [Gammaproteobacteria bacterium]|nr:dihydrolipoamide succinyltransferase [Gammaproteobacteria bacterium]